MSFEPNGELIPVGGGDSIPLIRAHLTLGRRDSCDIPLRFPNVSGMHCELVFQEGCWVIRDMNSTNGIKVNDIKVAKRVLRPGDKISIAKRHYTIEYTPPVGAHHALEEIMEDAEEINDIPLLEKAGLVKKPRLASKPLPGSLKTGRINESSENDDDEVDDED